MGFQFGSKLLKSGLFYLYMNCFCGKHILFGKRGLFVRKCGKNSFLSFYNSEYTNKEMVVVAKTLHITIITIPGIPWEAGIASLFQFCLY